MSGSLGERLHAAEDSEYLVLKWMELNKIFMELKKSVLKGQKAAGRNTRWKRG